MSKIERIGMGAYVSGFFLCFIDIRLLTIPLACFLLICLGAPFFPSYGFFLPTISRGISGKNAVSLTFDDGPDPESTLALLDVLKRHRISATFFVTGRNVDAYPYLVEKILADEHAIGNHTYSHDNLVMLKSMIRLHQEIEDTQQALKPFQVRPVVFRPPVGITNSRLWPVLRSFGMVHLSFSCRAGDFGNRRISRLSEKILKHVRSGDIILLHDKNPGAPIKLKEWLFEIDQILLGLEKRNIAVIPLTEMIDEPVMMVESRLIS